MLAIQSRSFGFVATKDLFGFLILRPELGVKLFHIAYTLGTSQAHLAISWM
jgi:hypothetical protein